MNRNKKPILLATDGSPTAEDATMEAIDLARALGVELVVVSTWDIPYSTLGYAAIPPNVEFAKLGEERAWEVVHTAAERARERGVEAHAMVLRGFPVEEICGAAKRVDPQLVVLGSHGWGAVRRAIFGSVSTGVLHHATCPVLVVPAAGARHASPAEDARAATVA